MCDEFRERATAVMRLIGDSPENEEVANPIDDPQSDGCAYHVEGCVFTGSEDARAPTRAETPLDRPPYRGCHAYESTGFEFDGTA